MMIKKVSRLLQTSKKQLNQYRQFSLKRIQCSNGSNNFGFGLTSLNAPASWLLRDCNKRWYHDKHIPSLELFEKAQVDQEKCAIVSNYSGNTSDAKMFTYGSLLKDSGDFANQLCELFMSPTNKNETGSTGNLSNSNHYNLKGKRVCFLFQPSYEYVVVQWAIWRAGGIAVPLCNTHPLPELEYYINDCEANVIVYDKNSFQELLNPLISRYPDIIFQPFSDISSTNTTEEMITSENNRGNNNNYAESNQNSENQVTNKQINLSKFDISPETDALIIYTSGTTGKPKGVVSNFENISTQVKSLLQAWEWKKQDHLLHCLPLHHLHGIINGLTCALWSGASVEFMKFDAQNVWKRFTQSAFPADDIPEYIPTITLFMGVPTMYTKLIAYFEEKRSDEIQNVLSDSAHKLRLMISGSSALPEPIFTKWKEITGHTILERYGMSEFGMALSNPLTPIKERRPGIVGKPLPFVEVKTVPENEATPEVGELLVKGKGVFKYYWKKPEATRKAFDDEWFKTGDIVSCVDDGSGGVIYKILGRKGVDIIKSKGYKISSLEIERVIMGHPLISEVSVIGVDDLEEGQKIAAVITLKADEKDAKEEYVIENLNEYCREKLAPYKVPSIWKFVDEIPKNAMGKVNKKTLGDIFKSKAD